MRLQCYRCWSRRWARRSRRCSRARYGCASRLRRAPSSTSTWAFRTPRSSSTAGCEQKRLHPSPAVLCHVLCAAQPLRPTEQPRADSSGLDWALVAWGGGTERPLRRLLEQGLRPEQPRRHRPIQGRDRRRHPARGEPALLLCRAKRHGRIHHAALPGPAWTEPPRRAEECHRRPASFWVPAVFDFESPGRCVLCDLAAGGGPERLHVPGRGPTQRPVRPRSGAFEAVAHLLPQPFGRTIHSFGFPPNCLEKGLPVRTWRLRGLYTKNPRPL